MVLAGFAEALESEYDAGWRDIVQEAALALLEGRDPREAARAARSEFRRANQLFIRDPQLLEELAA
jgi:aspartate/methionine/tyrosine aminotransferase